LIRVRKPSFHVTESIYIDVDKLNVILITRRYREVDGDDEIDLEFNKEDDVGHDNDENEEEDSD
jgi:hypothetical protein